MSSHKRGSAVGDPHAWKEHVLLTAYVDAVNNGHHKIAEIYAKIMQERKIKVPIVRQENIKFGYTVKKYPRWSSKKPDWSIMVYAVADEPIEDVLGPFPIHGGTKANEEKLLSTYEHTTIDDKNGKYELVRLPPDVLRKHLDLINHGSTYPGQQYTKQRPLMCVYDATKNYCENILGIKLNIDDEKFFIAHPMVQMDGVPFPDTLRVVQELIDPYGLGISTVRVAPGYNLKGDIAQWRGVLGVNPLAMSDRTTSNAEFLTQSPGSDASQWLFEYREDLLRPAIGCGVVGVHMANGMTGATNGHATYVAPRSSDATALLSFQILPNRLLKWKKQPVFAPLEAKKEAPPSKKDEQIEEVFDIEQWSWNKPHSTAVTVVKPSHFNVLTCCNRNVQHNTLGVPGVCDACWEALVEFVQCHDCAIAKIAVVKPAFSYTGYDWQRQEIYIKCNGCQKDYTFDRSFPVKKARHHVTKVLQALKRHADNEEINKLVDEHKQAVNEEKLLEEKPHGETLVDKVLDTLTDEWEKHWRGHGYD